MAQTAVQVLEYSLEGVSWIAVDLWICSCGDEGTRTPNPCLAKAVLCQLSYAPEAVSAHHLVQRTPPDGGTGSVASAQRFCSDRSAWIRR
jgi:hypothetical protein